MVQINFAQKQVNAKIVYYGPGMSGKTTNLEIVHQRAPEQNKGDLTSISTDGDRTLFFDFMPLDLGTVAGMRTCFQIYTVPGQVYYNSTRKLVLQGVDGVLFGSASVVLNSTPQSSHARSRPMEARSAVLRCAWSTWALGSARAKRAYLSVSAGRKNCVSATKKPSGVSAVLGSGDETR